MARRATLGNLTLTLALTLALALTLTLALTKVEFLTTDRILSAFFRRFIKGALP